MANRRHFLSILTGASWAVAACTAEKAALEDDLERALQDLNQAAGIGIADDDFALAREYAAGAYREAAKTLRPIVLDRPGLPVAFAAKESRDARRRRLPERRRAVSR
jgi:hypothetical protein